MPMGGRDCNEVESLLDHFFDMVMQIFPINLSVLIPWNRNSGSAEQAEFGITRWLNVLTAFFHDALDVA